MLLVVKDIYCLGTIAGMLLLSFTKQFTVMHYGINDTEGEYSGINSTFMKLAV